jgi:hypothetical protein
LHWQLGDFQDARQNRVASDEAQLVQPRKADVKPEHDSQQGRVEDWRRLLRRSGLSVCSPFPLGVPH